MRLPFFHELTEIEVMLPSIHRLYKMPLLRRLLLPCLARFNPGDITISHHYAKKQLRLHSYRHKGYWFHGRHREQETMGFFRNALKPGDTVFEVGGHIGYITMYFSQLVGNSGKVIVFEPGSNNIPYIRQNCRDLLNVELIERAVSDEDGFANFYEEELTGQNNSLNHDYKGFSINRGMAFSNTEYQQCKVKTVKLDTQLAETGLKPSLIKIDIEGAELMALEGGQRIIEEHLPILMVEVTNQKERVFNLLRNWGYILYRDTGEKIQGAHQLDLNVCALQRHQHLDVLDRCGWTR